MTRLTIMGMVIAVFALTGCGGDREIQLLRSNYRSLSDEVAYLKARITAVEEACLQINTRLVDAENRRSGSEQPAISKSKPVATSTREVEHVTLLSESKPSDKLTRSSFSRLVGMTISEVLTMLGKPNKVSEDGDTQSWNYKAVSLITENGGSETSPALIVFEQGCVSRAVLTEDVQGNSATQEQEAANTTTNTQQQK